MLTIEPETVSLIATIRDVGVIAALVWVLILFLQGKIVTSKVVDQMLDEADNRTIKLCNELKCALRDAVKVAILEAKDVIKKET